MILPALTMVGPGIQPPSIALRSDVSVYSGALPTSRMVVKPASSIPRALTTP
jgi:hypothetical protein